MWEQIRVEALATDIPRQAVHLVIHEKNKVMEVRL
jgi:hypothetical protein